MNMLVKSQVFWGFFCSLFYTKGMRDLLAIDEDPLYAKPNKKKSKGQADNGMQASGSKGKSVTGKGKKSRTFCNC